jgi:MtaA/CmuA family methyltransferase
MNSLQRFNNLLHGKPVDRIPNFDIFMTRAAHHISIPLSKYYQDHHALCEANLAVLKDFDLDIIQAISDPYREAADIGLEVEFPEDNLPLSKKPLILEPEALGGIRFPVKNFGHRMIDRLDGIRLMREQVKNEVPVMGWVEGALAEAADLRGMQNVMIDLVKRPAWLKELLEKCVEVEIEFACAQVDAGAQIIGLGDAVASQISARMYREFAWPYEQRIFAAVRAKGGIPRLHICGNTTHLLGDMALSGALIIDLDWMVDMHQAVETLNSALLSPAHDPLIVCGNLNPVSIFLQGTPAQVRTGVLANAAAGSPHWISAAGCEIPDKTPDENLRAQSDTLRELGGQVV